MFAPRLVMMEGVPGSGKSALAENIVAWTQRAGSLAELLPEEAIFNRPEFARVGRAFREKTFPTPMLMLEAYEQVFAAAREAEISVIADWNDVAMIEDLPCAQPDRSTSTTHIPSAVADMTVLRKHASDVRSAWRGQAFLLALEVPTLQAIARAAEERGPKWIEREVGFCPPGGASDAPLIQIAKRHGAYDARRQAIIRSHAEAGWNVCRIDASAEAEAVLGEAVALTFPDA